MKKPICEKRATYLNHCGWGYCEEHHSRCSRCGEKDAVAWNGYEQGYCAECALLTNKEEAEKRDRFLNRLEEYAVALAQYEGLREREQMNGRGATHETRD